MIEVPVGGTPIEPICALIGPPCFAHDGRYLGRGPLYLEENLVVGRWRRTEERRSLRVSPDFMATECMVEHFGRCEAVGRSTAYGDPAYAWRACDEASTLCFELELVGWRIDKLEHFKPNSEPEYRQWSAELKQLETHEKLLRKQIENPPLPPQKKLDPRRLPG